MSTTNNISFLENTAVAQILLYLYYNQQGINRKELSENVKAASETLDKTIIFLKVNGFLVEEKIKKFPPERHFTLTPIGLQVAQSLAAIAEALNSASTPKPASKP